MAATDTKAHGTEDPVTMEQGLDAMMKLIERLAAGSMQTAEILAAQSRVIDMLSTRLMALEDRLNG